MKDIRRIMYLLMYGFSIGSVIMLIVTRDSYHLFVAIVSFFAASIQKIIHKLDDNTSKNNDEKLHD